MSVVVKTEFLLGGDSDTNLLMVVQKKVNARGAYTVIYNMLCHQRPGILFFQEAAVSVMCLFKLNSN